MADLTPDQAIEKLRSLPEDKQRQVLSALSPEQRKGILTKLQGTKAAAPAKPFYERLGPVGKAVSSFESGFGVPESVQEHPSEAVQGVKQAVMHPSLEFESLKQMWNSMTKEQQDLINQAYFKQHQPGLSNKAEGFALGIYSAIPLFGPAIVNAVRQFQSGDKAGAVGSFAAIASQLYRPGEAKVPTEGTAGEFARPGEITKPKGERARALAQGLTGTGPESTTEPLIEKHKAEVGKAEEANRTATEQAFKKAGERKAAYEAKVREQEADYAKAVNEVSTFNAEQENITKQKTLLERQIDTESADLGTDIGTLENAVYQEANRQFDAVKAKVGNAQAPSDALIGTVKDAEKNILQGIPENIKEFRSILGLEGISKDIVKLRQDVMTGQGMNGLYEDLDPGHKALVDQIVEKYGSTIAPNEPLTWEKLQSLKSRLDQRLRGGARLNGDVKRAVFAVRDGVVDEMGKLAVPAGAGPEWDAAKSFYRQWREDFHEPTGPSGSGSPVAQALNAVDPENIRKPFIAKQSTIGNRGVNTLRKYGQFGGSQIADKAAKLVSDNEQLGTLKPKARKAMPERPKPVARPKDVEAEFKKPDPLTLEHISENKKTKLKQELANWKRFNNYDRGLIAQSAIGALIFQRWEALLAEPLFVGIKKIGLPALMRPGVMDWIAKPLPEELAALDRLPEELKADARGQLQTFIRQNDVRKVAPGVKAFLAGTAIRKERKKPGETLKDIRKIQESHGSNPSLPIGAEP